MEFYLRFLTFLTLFGSFNSQRDGILRSPQRQRRLCQAKFQFPTGWNSTSRYPLIPSCTLVSIPNGMEFYERVATSRRIRGSFNSQRDGILRSITAPYDCQAIVSIPNGMEFYLSFIPLPFGRGSFNSQRDGILLHRRSKSGAWYLFQFPTGWNSTRFNCVCSHGEGEFQFPTGWNSTEFLQASDPRSGVSIPNGMEFYKFTIFLKRMTKFVSIPNRMEFYGGNAMFAFFEFTSFQFPTGWNSTPRRQSKPQQRHRFNSQRDGILRSAPSVSRFIGTCFNSQRDGILLMYG